MEKLTARLTMMLQFLVGSHGEYITIRDLSDHLDVSEKTVKRELPAAEEWLRKHKLKLLRKPGTGLALEGSESDFASTQRELEEQTPRKDYTREERHYFIISELLLSKEPIKLYAFASQFKVTEGTLSNDLDRIEHWLSSFGITLVRKPGLGVYVEGTESHIRSALVHLLYESVDEYQLTHLVRDPLAADEETGRVQFHIRNRLLNLVDDGMMNQLQQYLSDLERDTHIKLTDSAYIGLTVHLALAIERIRRGQRITIAPHILDELKQLSEFQTARKLAQRLEQSFDISIPEDELGYITMHLKGAETRLSAESDPYYEHVSFELVKLARDILKMAETETGFELKGNSKLFAGFINHLGPAIERLRLGLDIRNPLLTQIKEQYGPTFEIARKCSRLLGEFTHREVPEAEIGYLAMHIGAMSEYAAAQRKPVKAIIACASGLGTSSLLSIRVKREFPSLQIIDVVSSSEAIRMENRADIIISTVEVDSHIPTVRVSPLLSPEDIRDIRTAVSQLEVTGDHPPIDQPAADPATRLTDTLGNHKETLTGMLDLTNGLVIKDRFAVSSVPDLIHRIAGMFTASAERSGILEQELHERERMGETVLSQDGLILLHCRSSVVNKLFLGIIRFSEPIQAATSPVDLYAAIVLLAPRDSSKAYLEAVNEVSKSLIDRPGFVTRLVSDPPAGLQAEISSMMKDLYTRKIEQYMMEVEQL
ncbi:BglG family transcription antiterminator [Paenibacillus wulumuqiensis]|uniref:BglG family transcription antiterminator n=1 Tax=Paenibacillus wulumuqiensis TaxID=1567107 RepID=UPI000619CB25|nr:BglG family transcription antiterminator [Paenibacillus wulumuqiensis]